MLKTLSDTISPTLVIGMGGAGIRVVGWLSRLFRAQPGGAESEPPETDAHQFLLLDTDDFEHLQSASDSENADFVSLGHFNPYHYAESELRSHKSDLHRWFDAVTLPLLEDGFIRDGASRLRMQGRLCLHYHYRAVEARLREKVDLALGACLPSASAEEKGGQRTVRVVLVASSCGGTGSAIFLDVAALVERLTRDRGATASILGCVLLPFSITDAAVRVDRDLVSYYRQNAWAFFQELNYALLHPERLHEIALAPWREGGRPAESTAFGRDLFETLFLIEGDIPNVGSLTLQQLFRYCAHGLHHVLSAIEDLAPRSVLSNVRTKLRERDRTFGLVKRFATFGFAEIDLLRSFGASESAELQHSVEISDDPQWFHIRPEDSWKLFPLSHPPCRLDQTSLHYDDTVAIVLAELGAELLNPRELALPEPVFHIRRDGRSTTVLQLWFAFSSRAVAGMETLRRSYRDRDRERSRPHITREWNEAGLDGELGDEACFISAPAGMDLTALRGVMHRLGMQWIDRSRLDPRIPVQHAVRDAFRHVSFVCAVLLADSDNTEVIFEMGMAASMDRPTFLFLDPAADLPSSLEHLPYARVEFSDAERLLDHLATYLRHLHSGIAQLTWRRPTANEKTLSRPSHSFGGLSLFAEGDIKRQVASWFEAAGVVVSEASRIHPGPIDMAVWVDSVSPTLGNPVLVQVESGRLSQTDLDAAEERLRAQLHSTGAEVGILIYRDATGTRFPQRRPGWPPVWRLELQQLHDLLVRGEFELEMVRCRNMAVHG